MSSEALEARLDDLRQVCSAPGDAYSAGEWCEAANEGVQIALALLAALAVAREREQRYRELLERYHELAPALADCANECGEQVLYSDLHRANVAARAALVDEPAAAHPMIVREYPKHDDRAREALALLREFYELQQGPQSLVHADGPLVDKITAALAALDEPAAATLAEPGRDNVYPGLANQSPEQPGSASAAADEPGETACL